jgi:hypothetical protein
MPWDIVFYKQTRTYQQTCRIPPRELVSFSALDTGHPREALYSVRY